MVILGINGGTRAGYMDVAAALVVDGKLVSAIEEERLNRIKHSPGQLPYLSIQHVLKASGLSIHDVDVVATHGETWGVEYLNVLKDYFKYHFGYCPRIERVHHHTAHAASSYLNSGFREALILTVDNSGDGISTQVAIGSERDIKIIHREERPNSLGIFYSMMTQFCGFRREFDEFKLMGLAAYGTADTYDLSSILSLSGQGKYQVNEKFLVKIPTGSPSPNRQQPLFNHHLPALLGDCRIPGSPITTKFKDVAASVQKRLEEALTHLISHYSKETGINTICLAGGVALNSAANGKISEMDFVHGLYIPPFSGDAGVAIGAAQYTALAAGSSIVPSKSAYLGGEWSNEHLSMIFKKYKLKTLEIHDPAAKASDLITQNKVIGWFQGAAEFGPRALGNRSILANPRNPNIKDLINKQIKNRETFRPLCPSVLEEDFRKFANTKRSSTPYMTMALNTKEGIDESVPCVIHKDQTARFQTVTKEQNDLYYNLLLKMKEKNGIGMLLNTSFNTNGAPIVNDPAEAIASFFSSGLDALIIGNYLLEK